MRLWTLHPRYLDAKGLVALWREALLAQAVIAERTIGYRHHPQLERFRATKNPHAAISGYLRAVKSEADRRGYRFDGTRIDGRPPKRSMTRIAVTNGQVEFEWRHLLAKLEARDRRWLAELPDDSVPSVHPSFVVVAGEREPWERGG